MIHDDSSSYLTKNIENCVQILLNLYEVNEWRKQEPGHSALRCAGNHDVTPSKQHIDDQATPIL